MEFGNLFLSAASLVVCFTLAVRFFKYFLRGGKNLKKYGQWAIVTGATDGIGKAMADELARKGLNIVLISRTQAKLDAVAQEITEKRGVQTKTVQVDFCQFDEAAQNAVRAAIADLDVGVLINNVGISYSFPEYFSALDDARVEQLISLNVTSCTLMTRLVLPGMEERKRGAIVNMSSAAACVPSPLLSQYAAAKGYMINFSVSLAAELACKGVAVQCQTPLFVTTKLAKIRRSSITVPTPATYARAAVRAIGYESLISPYWAHAAMLYVFSWLPESVVASVANSQHLAIRKRALRKLKSN